MPRTFPLTAHCKCCRPSSANPTSLLRWSGFFLVILYCLSASAWKKERPQVSTARWAEGSPGCTFERGDDGKYRYGMWSGDVGIIVAVDSQELQKTHKRLEHVFGVFITARYRGNASLDFRTENISLEYASHYQVIKSSLDPDDFANKLQTDVDALNDETARETKKHPETKDEREARVQVYLKDATEMQEFLTTRSLRDTKLDASVPETNGWVFFSTTSKWIGDWKKKEDFVLRIPVGERVFEFPFSLPPVAGDLILRKRE